MYIYYKIIHKHTMTTIWKLVTYPSLKQYYNAYTWDSSVGSLGAFLYKDNNNTQSNKTIELKNIGDIKLCDDSNNYSVRSDVLGVSNTTVDLSVFGVPIGTPFGWDDKANAWVYFTNNNALLPSHYALYCI